jgi:hypothetical protein
MFKIEIASVSDGRRECSKRQIVSVRKEEFFIFAAK